MPCCAALGCSNRKDRGKRMHRFPRDPVRRKLWEERLRRSNWKANDGSILCEDHFDETQYETRRLDKLRKLKPNAVPTKFAFLKKKPSPPRLDKCHVDLTPFVQNNAYLSQRICVEHAYNQNPRLLPTEVEADAEIVVSIDENLSSVEEMAINIDENQSSVEELVINIDANLSSIQELSSIEEITKQTSKSLERQTEEQIDHPHPNEARTPSEDFTPVIMMVTVEDVLRKKDQRIASLLKALAQERRENHRLVRQRRNLELNIAKVFNSDQLERLGRKSSRGVKWSPETMEKGLQLFGACGSKGYELLLAQNQPLPAMRSLRKIRHEKKSAGAEI